MRILDRRNERAWEALYAPHNENFGMESLLGRTSEREVALRRPLCEQLAALNLGLPMTIRCDELPLLWPPKRAANRGKYELMRDGVQLSF